MGGSLAVGVPVTRLAKWKTVVQMVAIGFLLAGSAGDKIWPYTTLFGLSLLWIAALFTLYTGYEIVSCHAIRITRDAEIPLGRKTAEDLLTSVEAGLRERRMGDAVRLQYDADLPAPLLAMLVDELELGPDDLYAGTGFTAFSDLFQLYAAVDLPRLKDHAMPPRPVPAFEGAVDIWSAIRAGDVLAHHPYHSFDAVTRFVREAYARLGALPAGSRSTHTRYLCKRLRARFPDLRIIVGRWGLRENVARARRQLEAAGAEMHAGQRAYDLEMAEFLRPDVHQKILAVGIVAVEALNRVLHRSRKFTVRAAELFQRSPGHDREMRGWPALGHPAGTGADRGLCGDRVPRDSRRLA